MTNRVKESKKARRERVLVELRRLERDGDTERAHVKADALLIELIDDPEVMEAYEAIQKWYA